MTVTTIDPQTALVVIDLQAGIVSLPLAHPIDGVVEQSVRLVEAFRARELPVVLVNVAGAPAGRNELPPRAHAFPDGWTELIPELDQQPGDLLITKHTKGAFTNTGLEEALRELGVTQVVLVGVATGTGVESTARDAHERGFHVTVVSDAVTDSRQEAHDYALEVVFPKIAETGTTDEVLSLLAAA